ncbi:MAG: RNA 2',3'-cyclic phosphodiesterase [bacterium]
MYINGKRIFLAINLPLKIRKQLLDFQSEWADLPVSWTIEQNLHITLVFIGYVDNEQMLEICQTAQQIVQNHPCFEIKLNKICLGPPNRSPRMIWVKSEENPVLTELKNDLEKLLIGLSNSRFNISLSRSFQAHITLARIRQAEWKRLDNKPIIEKEISLIFPVDSIEVMQSNLSKKGPSYAILESAELVG